MLTLVSVTPFWAVALKLVRYTKWDPGDICLLLRSVIISDQFTACLSVILIPGENWRCGGYVQVSGFLSMM